MVVFHIRILSVRVNWSTPCQIVCNQRNNKNEVYKKNDMRLFNSLQNNMGIKNRRWTFEIGNKSEPKNHNLMTIVHSKRKSFHFYLHCENFGRTTNAFAWKVTSWKCDSGRLRTVRWKLYSRLSFLFLFTENQLANSLEMNKLLLQFSASAWVHGINQRILMRPHVYLMNSTFSIDRMIHPIPPC